MEAAPHGPPLPTLAQAARVWLRIGLTSFGGPAGQIALMHRELVEERGWVGEERFLHALNFCHLLPGPEAMQLAAYVGWLLHGTWGGVVAGSLFVLPGFAVVLGLSMLYAAWGQVPLAAALLAGVKPAVLAVVLLAVARMGGKSLRTPYQWGLAGGALAAIFCYQVPFPLVVAGAALLGWLGGSACPDYLGDACPGWVAGAGAKPAPGGLGGADARLDAAAQGRARPSWAGSLRVLGFWSLLWWAPLAILALALGPGHVLVQLGVFFSKMAVVTFGGAYAVLAYVAQEAVSGFGWVSAADMLAGLALAESTPGPLILVLQFVGYLAAYREPGALAPLWAGVAGAALTVWVTFIPCFLWIFLGAPYIERLRGVAGLRSALSGVTAAVVGVVLNLALWFGLHALFSRVGQVAALGARLPWPDLASLDLAGLGLALGAAVALARFRVGMVKVLAGCALAGALLGLGG
jgi:chromate transporter